MKRGLAVALALAAFTHAARARADVSLGPVGAIGPINRPVGITKLPAHPIAVPAVVNSHVLYLNRCAAGCRLTYGQTDATKSESDISQACDQGGNGGDSTLTAFSAGDTKWNEVVSCMQTMMAPFDITVTETDPGSAPHFEVMIAGSPGDIGCSADVAGIADGLCQSTNNCEGSYYPNALVFSFANVWQGDVTSICGTSAQEIAHAWGLDHTIDASDPMTYKNYTSTLSYKNNEKCGSDCVNGKGPLGEACTGDGLTGTHLCNQNGLATQNEVDTISALFGASNGTPPTVKLTAPTTGSTVTPGFTISASCTSTDSSAVAQVQFSVDGTGVGTSTSAPYSAKAPASITSGSHTVEATCVTSTGQSASADATVTVSKKLCTGDSDCSPSTDVCVNGSCVVGPDANGGLGITCTGNAGCASGMCVSDGSANHCVVACDETVANQCPGGFSCIDGGTGTGVCWPEANADNGGGGGCDTGGGNAAPIAFGLAFAALLVTRRRSSAA